MSPKKPSGGGTIVTPLPDVDEVPSETEEEEIVEELPEDPTMPEETDVVLTDIFKENRTSFIVEDVNEIDGHLKIVSTDSFDLYLKEENLSIILRNKDTGSLLYSTVEKPDKTNDKWSNFVRSGIVIEYLQDTNIVYYQADMYSEDPVKSVTVLEDGFKAHVKYPKLEFEFQLEVRLKDDVLNAFIPRESIVENSDKYKVANFYVYPMMGYTKMDEEQGYMFIPDGSGSLIRFDNHKGQFKQPFNQMIYGSNIGIDDSHVLSLFNNMKTSNDNTGILMPVFGAVHSDKEMGFIGIINQGDESARLYAYPNGAVTPYNWITPSFIYRQFYNQLTSATTGTMVIRQKEKNNFDIDIQYHLLSGENATYVGMAHKYHDYLSEKGLIQQKEIPYKTRIDFLGSEVKTGLLKRKTVSMTSFDEMKSILDELDNAGVKDTTSIVKGWQEGGPYSKLPNKDFTIDKELGNINHLQDLDDSHQLYFESDFLRYNPSTNNLNSSSLVKKLNKRTYIEEVHGKVFKNFNYITPEESEKNAEHVSNQYLKNNLNNISIQGIGEKLYSYLYKNKTHDRVHTASIYQSIFKNLKDKGMMINSSVPQALYWQYQDAILDVQVDSSNYVFVGEEVPFLPIVLKSSIEMYAPYTNFNANHEAYVLNMIEYGTFPSFIVTEKSASELQLTNSSGLYSTKFEQYKDQIVEYDAIFKNISNLTQGSRMIDHKRDGKLVSVSYDNGVKIHLNYGSKELSVNDITIQAMNYEVEKP